MFTSPTTWPCATVGGGTFQEYALQINRRRSTRILIAPSLFDEGNRMRRFTVDVMRHLDALDIDCFLPDYPGTNESLQRLEHQTPSLWSEALNFAAQHFDATHVLGIRGGCLFTSPLRPSIHYAPIMPDTIIRRMFRARVVQSLEAGLEETREQLLAEALRCGLKLQGHELSRTFFQQFLELKLQSSALTIGQDQLGESGLWLRSEAGESQQQATSLALTICNHINV